MSLSFAGVTFNEAMADSFCFAPPALPPLAAPPPSDASAGFTWSEVAQAADLGSAETARIRAQRAKEAPDLSPALRWRREHGAAPRPTTSAPGISVTEAAKKLGVSRKTVYARIRSGRLQTATDEAGRTRVVLDDS